MKNIPRDAAVAWRANTPFKRSNTEVRLEEGYTKLILFGNTIARKTCLEDIEITNCGWETYTTKDRLNAIGANILQRNKKWYRYSWDERNLWDGKWTDLCGH